jgi:glycosyltransferase A (GT-A) superfamily protein (DUF2064 family)
MRDAAVLIFADALGQELARKNVARRHAGLLALPAVDGRALDADVFVSGGEGATFGERLSSALGQVRGYRRVVIVGRDCPSLNQGDVAAALRLLETHDTVLGPDGRGGCYLIGLRGEDLGKLDAVRWCRGEDFAALWSAGESVAVLAEKADLDHSGDLPEPTPVAWPEVTLAWPQFTAARWQLPPPC